jgi:hypothetical protein
VCDFVIIMPIISQSSQVVYKHVII